MAIPHTRIFILHLTSFKAQRSPANWEFQGAGPQIGISAPVSLWVELISHFPCLHTNAQLKNDMGLSKCRWTYIYLRSDNSYCYRKRKKERLDGVEIRRMRFWLFGFTLIRAIVLYIGLQIVEELLWGRFWNLRTFYNDMQYTGEYYMMCTNVE